MSGEGHLPACDGTNTPSYNGTLNCARDSLAQNPDKSYETYPYGGRLWNEKATVAANHGGNLTCDNKSLA
jgi:hypothetical protein